MAKGNHGGARIKPPEKMKDTENLITRHKRHVIRDLKRAYPRYIIVDGKRKANPLNLNKQMSEFAFALWLALPHEKAGKI